MADNNMHGPDKNPSRTLFYIAVVLCALGAAAFALAFFTPGIYALISAVLLQIGALAFSASQKKKNAFKELKYLNICAYILLGLSAALFIGGLIYSATV